jgi:hypothetical protein
MQLNYVSCLLTVISTVLVGKRLWHGWMLAGLNSVIICLIGFQTKQWGFIPANLFCLAIYAHNIRKWRGPERESIEVRSTAKGASAGVNTAPQALENALVSQSDRPLRHKPRRFRHSYSLVRAGSHRLRARLQSEERTQARLPVVQDIPCQVDPRRNVS